MFLKKTKKQHHEILSGSYPYEEEDGKRANSLWFKGHSGQSVFRLYYFKLLKVSPTRFRNAQSPLESTSVRPTGPLSRRKMAMGQARGKCRSMLTWHCD